MYGDRVTVPVLNVEIQEDSKFLTSKNNLTILNKF